jgi:periplasmic protein CpxP/Spy
MKKIIILLAACLGLNMAVSAQEMQKAPGKMKEKKNDWTPEQRAEKGAKWAEKALGLNADQKAKWQAAALTRMQANGPLREQMKNTKDKAERQKIREQIKGNITTFDNTVNGFLTPEQKTKWDDIKKKKMDENKARREQYGKGKGKNKDKEEESDDDIKDVDQG